MMSATLPWLRSARVGTGGGLASPGYKMISLGYKFQAETPAARSPPFLLVTTLLCPLSASSSSFLFLHLFPFHSFFLSLSLSLPARNISIKRLPPNKQNIRIIFRIPLPNQLSPFASRDRRIIRVIFQTSLVLLFS